VLASGSRLGPYEVVAQIGEGGMGVVDRARDTRLQRDVALKVPEAFANDPDALARFRREAQVLDFGLAKAMDSAPLPSPNVTNSPTLSLTVTGAGVIVGTVAHMSPEQAKGLPVGPQTDVFALGAVLYEMLTHPRVTGGGLQAAAWRSATPSGRHNHPLTGPPRVPKNGGRMEDTGWPP
jgi:serine/threonine protein kinase